MPIYAFKCPTCGTQKEEIVKMGTTKTTCEKCGGESEKQLSMRFHGHGLPNGFSSNRSKSRGR